MRPDMNLTMGEFVVMPNHFHGIIVIGENQYNNRTDSGRRAMHCAPTGTTSSNSDKPKNQFGPQSKNLASIIRGFKIGVTKNARIIYPNFAWQSRFYDHIIRNDESHQRITNYIKTIQPIGRKMNGIDSNYTDDIIQKKSANYLIVSNY